MGVAGAGYSDGVRWEDCGDGCGGYDVHDSGEGGADTWGAHEHQGTRGAHRTQHRKGEKGQLLFLLLHFIIIIIIIIISLSLSIVLLISQKKKENDS